MLVGGSIARFPHYIIFNDGTVYSKYTRRHLKPILQDNGYFHVTLCENKKHTQIGVHNLVAEVFLGARPNGCITNHKNGLKIDNRIENLEWISIQENVKHAYRNNLRTINKEHRERCAALGRSKRSYSDQDAQDIRALFSGARGEKIGLAKMFGLSRYAVASILGGK